ncbi:SMC5-SMC6 complex localization factor protein 2 isoform X2 [Crotalus tigris]|uniref:SMC5-SMC6 complex localization factor protein 2 isoform X2 n=1 Tax=Crotalus tigris TaxID=88082 RepID=UPI00192F13EF|nr:SMC5-SMC6 complex localization factor protein 2 isoform X2 [Crotalus tigris]
MLHRKKMDSGEEDAGLYLQESKCITDFFRPTLKPDRTVLCSPEKGNGHAGHTVSCVDHLKKSISSSKQNRKKKLPCSLSGRSPIIDALFRKAKSEKNNSPENGVCKILKANHPKPVVRRLFISNALPDGSFLLKDIYTTNLERNENNSVRTRTHLIDNSNRQHKTEHEDLDTTGSSLNKWPSTSGNNSLKKQSDVTQCQKPVYSRLPQVSSISSSSPESLGTLCRKRQEKDTKDFLRKDSSSVSLESSSDESSSAHASKNVFHSGLNSDKTIVTKSQPNPTAYSSAIPSFGIANHKHARKRKRISSKTNVKNLQNVQTLNKHRLGSSQIPHNTNYSKHRISSHKNLHSADIDWPSSDLPISVEKSEAENKSNGYIINKNDQIQISDTSKRKLQTSTCHIYLETRRNNDSTVPSEKNAEQLGSSLGECDSVVSLEDSSCDTIPNSSYNLNKSNNEAYELIQKLKSISDSDDEASDCSVVSSEEETLIPLEKILLQSVRPAAKKSEEAMNKDKIASTISTTHNASLSKPFIERGASYMNHLEHLLKEKEELTRVDELENQLQQVKEIVEINSEPEDRSTDGELSAEHREFIERYSFSQDAIPDHHPGENIFQIVNAGKIFSQNNLDLRNFGFHPQNLIEKYLLRSGITQQLFVTVEGLLASTYHNSPCPVPILKWMFQMMSIHPDSTVSRKILDTLMLLTIRNFSDKNDQQKPWIPSLFDITTVLINMGISFSVLFPLQHFQPGFTENDIVCEMHVTVNKQSKRDICINPTAFFLPIESNLCNIAKFLRLCINVCPESYTDREIFMLLLLLFKISLETELKQFPLVDLECLIIKLLENVRNWDTEMSQLSLAISCLSNHHHNLLWLVQFVPNWTTRGRQIRRHLSLVIISKLLKSHVKIPSSHDHQMSLLCKELVKMKPSSLLKSLSETSGHHDGVTEPFLSESEPQAYYLTYVLLHLVREASNFEHTSSNQRKWLLRLCSTLEKHVKCDIREDVRLFYRTMVKDLVARTYSKWQQMIHSSQLTQGQIHDFWVPDT